MTNRTCGWLRYPDPNGRKRKIAALEAGEPEPEPEPEVARMI